MFHRDGKQIETFREPWKRACTKAGVAGRYVHDLGRTAVRNLERAGVPRSVTMRLTGHKSEGGYRRYAIVSEADLALGVKKLGNLLRTALAESPCYDFGDRIALNQDPAGHGAAAC